MSEVFKRGARVRDYVPDRIHQIPTLADLEATKKRVTQREAFAVAKANMHKPWARRYLRQLGNVNFGKGSR